MYKLEIVVTLRERAPGEEVGRREMVGTRRCTS